MFNNSFNLDSFSRYLISEYNIIKLNNQLHIYKNGIYINDLFEIESKMIQNIPNLTKNKRTEVLAYLNLLIRENSKEAGAEYIAFKNGLYNIFKQQLESFNNNYILTNKIDFNYNENAFCEITDKTLNDVSCENIKIRMLLEELIGYTFYRRNEFKKAFILIGEKNNGKSTFLDLLSFTLGKENISALSLKELNDRFKPSLLFHKLANIGDDIDNDTIGESSIFKKIVSGDRIIVERKNEHPFEFNPYSKLIFSANDLPKIKDKTGAALSRIILIPFSADFTENRNPFLRYQLQTEEAAEYLIKIGIEGLLRLIKNQSFTKAEEVEKAINNYKIENNPVLEFCNKKTAYEITGKPVKSVFEEFQELYPDNRISNIEFSKQIKKHLNVDVRVAKIAGKSIRVYTTLLQI